jgi:hypothetical protein
VNSPPTVLVQELAASRRRGASFAAAWPVALAGAVHSAPQQEREDWADVLGGMYESWRAAFERRPASRPELALAIVAHDPERVLIADDFWPDVVCRHCSRPIPKTRDHRASYCSSACKARAYEARQGMVLV